MKYHAFISYSHSDREWGEWLHRGIETFRVPRGLVGRKCQRSGGQVPGRLFPVFRDREELPTSADLGTMLREALDSSRYLVVICSPRAARSRWVNEEVLHFKRSGRGDRVLCLIVEGEPNASDARLECFPPGLRHPLTAEGDVDVLRHEEPIAADARPQGDGKRLALMKVVAGLAEVGFDELRQREQERSRRAMRRWLAVAAALVFVFAGLAFFAMAQRDRAIAEEQRARETLSRSDFFQADELMARGEPHAALLHLSRAVASDPEDIAARQRLAAVLKIRSWPYEVMNSIDTGDIGLREISPLPSGDAFLTQSSAGYHQIWGKDGVALSPPLLHEDVEWFGALSYLNAMEPNGDRVASGGHDGKVRLWKMPGGESVSPACDLGSEVTAMVAAPNGEHLVAGTEEGRVFLVGWNGEHHELSDFPPDDAKGRVALALSGDGRKIAAAWGGGAVRIASSDGRGESLDLAHPGQVNAITFSADGNNLITGGHDGGLRIWDPETGRLKQEIVLSDAIGRVRVSPDGFGLLVGFGYFGDAWKAALFSPQGNGSYVMKCSVTHPNRDIGNRVGSSGFGDCGFSPDGRRFLTWTMMDREVRCWSVVDGRMEMEPFLHPSPVGGAAFRGPEDVVTAAADGRIRVWKWSTPHAPEVERLPAAYWFYGVWSAVGKRWLGLARGDGDGSEGIVATLERTPDGWNVRNYHLADVAMAACLTASGDQAFVGLLEGGALRLDWENGNLVPIPGLEKVKVELMGMAGSSHLLLATRIGKVIRYNLRNHQIEETREFEREVRFMETDSSGEWAVVGMDSGAVWWMPTAMLSSAKQLSGHALMMAAAVFSKCNEFFATADQDGRILAWRIGEEPKLLFKVRQDAEVTALAFTPDGSVLAAGGRDDRVNCWSVEGGGELLSTIATRTWVAELDFNKDGRRLLVSDIKGFVGSCDSWTGRWIVDPLAMNGEAASSGWCGDGMFGLDRGGSVHYWEFSPPSWQGLAELGESVSKCEFTNRGALKRKSDERGFRDEMELRGISKAMVDWWINYLK